MSLTTSRDQDSAALSRSLATSQADYVRFPGFLSRQHQQDSEGYPTSRTPLNSAAKWFKTRWPTRSRSVDSLERYPDPDTHRDRPPTPPSAPRSEGPQMYHPPTQEQQSEARRQRAAARTRNRDGIPDQREEDSNTRERTQSHEDHNPPQENLTNPPDDWSPRQNLDELRQLPTPLLPLVPQPDSRLPPATNHSHGDNTMTTHSVTQTRQSMDTRTPTARPHIQTDPARGLEVLFGDTTQPTPTEEPTLPYRPEVIGPSHSQRTTTTREAQTSHPIPGRDRPDHTVPRHARNIHHPQPHLG